MLQLVGLTSSFGNADGLFSSFCLLPWRAHPFYLLNPIFIRMSSTFVPQAHLSPERWLLPPAVNSHCLLNVQQTSQTQYFVFSSASSTVPSPFFQNQNHCGLMTCCPSCPSTWESSWPFFQLYPDSGHCSPPPPSPGRAPSLVRITLVA